MHIDSVIARQIYDSRGNPTVECDIVLDSGQVGRAAAPSGASTGSGEALELRDGGAAYGGKGVTKAVENVRTLISSKLKGHDVTDQRGIDDLLNDVDGTGNKGKLGANATTAVSLAVARAAAAVTSKQLYEYLGGLVKNTEFTIPMPMFNVLNGGKHAEGSTDIQEFMIVPVGAATIEQALRMASETYHELGKLLKQKGYATSVGDEGGYAPRVANGSNEALDLMVAAIRAAGYEPGKDLSLALDVAASELVSGNSYDFKRAGAVYTADDLIELYGEFIDKFPLISLEDGLGEQDWNGWKKQTSALGSRVQLVADDLLVTNTTLLKKAIEQKSANAILIKPNQIGTLSETIDAVRMAKRAGWNTVISHRSGETEDTFIAHLAVGLNAGQIKTGSFARSDRVAKYNELIRIAETLPNAILAKPFKK